MNFLKLVLAASMVLGCASSPGPRAAQGASTPDADSDRAVALVSYRGRRLMVSGALPPSNLRAVSAFGVSQVIDLRTATEPGQAEEVAIVHGAGMSYVHFPVDGPEALNEARARALAQAIMERSGHAVIHCSTGNRAAALLAMTHYFVDDFTIAASLEVLESTGFTRLAPKVRQVLEAHCRGLSPEEQATRGCAD